MSRPRLKAFAPVLLQVSNTRLQGPASRHQRDAAGWLASAWLGTGTLERNISIGSSTLGDSIAPTASRG